MLEPENNPTASYLVDPSRLLRFLVSKRLSGFANAGRRAKKRVAVEKKRKAQGLPHVVEYFHQVDDPYSHLMAQVVAQFAERYDIEVVPHLIRATGGRSQPEEEKLAVWARRDCGLIAPHYGLSFPDNAGVVPEPQLQQAANRALTKLGAKDFLNQVKGISTSLWSDGSIDTGQVTVEEAEAALEAGSARLAELDHYSGAMLYYAGEWYWGVDRLFHLEERLRELGVCKEPGQPYIAPRPELDVRGVDASGLQLHFFPSLNSPYTAIIYDNTIELSRACKINLHHKPVLPMVMRGVPAPPSKVAYIFFDVKRESEFLGVPFGNTIITIGDPVRQSYSLMPWAKSLGKDTELLST